MQLSHVNQQGEANMVDVSGKAVTTREAIAEGELQITVPPRAMCWLWPESRVFREQNNVPA